MSKTGGDGRRKLGQREGSKENLVEWVVDLILSVHS